MVDMVGFRNQGIDPIVRTVKEGRSCFSLTIAKDKREIGKYGDTDEVPLHRNQLSELYRHHQHEIWEFELSVLIPDDFALDGESAITGTHSTYATPSLFYLLHINDKLVLKTRYDIIREDLIIPNEWVDWRVSINMQDNNSGWLHIWRNGVLVHEHNGPVLLDADELMYFKIGPYVWDNYWPKNYRRFFFQI